MSLRVFTIDEKIAALEIEVERTRQFRSQPGTEMHRHYELLKSVVKDLKGRQEFPRSNALGALTREVQKLIASKSAAGGYDQGRMVLLANMLIARWPTVSQALEQFGEESCE